MKELFTACMAALVAFSFLDADSLLLTRGAFIDKIQVIAERYIGHSHDYDLYKNNRL
jgi:hypothetical protein